VLEQVTSEPISGIYERTYTSLLERVEADGFFQESLTGAYAGMFPRTVGGLVSLFLETGELDACERLIGCALQATEDNEMTRIPHVFDRRANQRAPLEGGDPAQPDYTIALYRLDNGYYGAQYFLAPKTPIEAFEAYLAVAGCTGTLTLSVRNDRTEEALYTRDFDIQTLTNGWVRLPVEPPLALEAGQRYDFRLSFEGEGSPLWFGLNSATDHPLAGAYAHDGRGGPEDFLDQPGHVTAFAVDAGNLRHSEDKEGYPILSDWDQIDGQAHLLMAWGRLANRRGPTAFEDRTWPLVAALMSRTVEPPYMLYQGMSIGLGLVHNFALEHSREGRFWDCWDILAQSFVSAALEELIPIADRRGDAARARKWRNRYETLQGAIQQHLTWELDGKRVYMEMRLPDSGAGVPFEGLGWLNFGAVAAQWKGMDVTVMRNTVAALRQRALRDWHGHVWLADDWWPDGSVAPQVIGKGVGWEIAWCLREGEWERIGQWMDFLTVVHPEGSLYMEAASLFPDDTWHLQDSGNGEQCSWWCWGMARLRKELGLSAAP
jgi:hypothetical protein